jgi:hypothetical protein
MHCILTMPHLQRICKLYTSMLPSKCNIYFTLICSFTRHVSALINHHQMYFTLLKTVNCSNIIINLHYRFLSKIFLQVLCLKVFLHFLKFLKSFIHCGIVYLFGLCVLAFLFLYIHSLLHLLLCVPLLVVCFAPLLQKRQHKSSAKQTTSNIIN